MKSDMPGNFLASHASFLRGLILNPADVSSPTPSSPRLARAIAAQVDISRPGLVIELGPGTGAVTEALVNRGIGEDRIIAVEKIAYFADLTAKRFPLAKIHCGNALAFEKYLAANAPVAAIVSGLPLLNFPPNMRRSLVTRALGCQGVGGCFIQLSYGWVPPVNLEDLAVNLSKAFIVRNFPPAHIWTYRTT